MCERDGRELDSVHELPGRVQRQPELGLEEQQLAHGRVSGGGRRWDAAERGEYACEEGGQLARDCGTRCGVAGSSLIYCYVPQLL